MNPDSLVSSDNNGLHDDENQAKSSKFIFHMHNLYLLHLNQTKWTRN